jgi:murein DD-endopeptidase MepM/ murein hydrolase activator NlpD
MALHPTAAEELVTMRTPSAWHVRAAVEQRVSGNGVSRNHLILAAMLVAGALFVSPVDAATRPKTATLTFEWPAHGTRIVPLCGLPGHKGIDLSLSPGTAIHAAEAGRVAYAGSELRGFPNLIFILHNGGWVSAYALNDDIFVKRGDVVKRGQVIATAGRGSIEGRPFHFELRHGSKAVDPLIYLRPKAATAAGTLACGSR